jgi:hypothetical protein
VEGAGDGGGELEGGGGGGVCKLQDAVELIVEAGMTEEELEGRVSCLLHPPASSVLCCTAPSAAVAISGDASLAATGLFVPLSCLLCSKPTNLKRKSSTLDLSLQTCNTTLRSKNLQLHNSKAKP